jgi:superfamily II DNA or RNA helicase
MFKALSGPGEDMPQCARCGGITAEFEGVCRKCRNNIYGYDNCMTWDEFYHAELADKDDIASIALADEELLLYHYYCWERDVLGSPTVSPRLRKDGQYRSQYMEMNKWFASRFFSILRQRWEFDPQDDDVNRYRLEDNFMDFNRQVGKLLIGVASSSNGTGRTGSDRTHLLFTKLMKINGIDPMVLEGIDQAFIPGSALYFLELYMQLHNVEALEKFQSCISRLGKKDADALIDRPMVIPLEWEHQKCAFQAWERNGHIGIIEMATGTGKTLVGLMAIEKLHREVSNGTVLVLGPSKAILNQWRREVIDKLGLRSDVSQDYTHPLIVREFKITFETFQSAYRQPWAYEADLLIVDEVHHGAARSFKEALRIKATWRMGLSATVEGEVRGKVLASELGRTVFNFSLEDAIRKNVLPKFKWKIHPTYLSVTEEDEFTKLSREIKARFQMVRGDSKTIKTITRGEMIELRDLHDFTNLLEIARYRGIELPETWKALQVQILRRRWIIHRSQPKLEQAIELARSMVQTKKIIMFAMDTGTCDRIAAELKNECQNVFVAHSRTGTDANEQILKFRKARDGILIGAKMLEEGIDIPDADVGISVSSSKSRLQLIQRMGRILRNKPGKKPVFHHYLALPDPSRYVAEEDDLRYMDDLSWAQETALKLGMYAELVEEEIELSKVRMGAEEMMRKRICERRQEDAPGMGTVKVANVIKMMPEDVRERLISIIGNIKPSSKVTDRQWAELLREAYGRRENEPLSLPGSWYLLIAADRSPEQLVKFLG